MSERVQLDIAGNFAAGQQAMIDRRRAKQLERQRDYDLAAEDDLFKARRSDMEYGGWNPDELSELQTNQDPWFMRLKDWWKQRRATRVMPSRPMPEQIQTVEDEVDQLMQPATTYPMAERGGAISVTPYRDGGRVRAIPRYADGGNVVNEDEMIRRRAAANRARNPAQVTARTETAIPRRPGLASRLASGGRRLLNRAGSKAAPLALGATAVTTGMTPTEQYRERFGLETNDPSFLGDIGVRALGAASDLGNILTLGAAGQFYRDKQRAIPTAEAQVAAPEQPPESPMTPDEAIAERAIEDGTRMAEEATAASAPPGAIDFSKVDFNPEDMPNMGVKDWVGFRQQAIKSLTARGTPINEAYQQAMDSVSKMQQQGFIDYANQAFYHLQANNPKAAALAMRAAYQYFPNGSDVEFRIGRGQDGKPVIAGFGVNEETGEPVGSPMILSAESLPKMIENFSQPGAWSTWMKDIRAEELDRRKFFEVERPEAESNAIYRDRTGRASLLNAEANLTDAQASLRGAGGRRQTDYDRANEAFQEASFDLATDEDPGAGERIAALMSRIYTRKPNMQYTEVIDFVKEAARRGELDRLMTAAGIPTE